MSDSSSNNKRGCWLVFFFAILTLCMFVYNLLTMGGLFSGSMIPWVVVFLPAAIPLVFIASILALAMLFVIIGCVFKLFNKEETK